MKKLKLSYIKPKMVLFYFAVSVVFSLLSIYFAYLFHGRNPTGLLLNDFRLQFFMPHMMHTVLTVVIIITSINNHYMNLPLNAVLRMKDNTKLILHQYLTVIIHAAIMTIMLAIEWVALVFLFIKPENRVLPEFVIPSAFFLYFLYVIFVCSIMLLFSQIFKSLKMGIVSSMAFILLELLTVNGAFFFIGQFKSLAWWCMLGFEKEMEIQMVDALYPIIVMILMIGVLFCINSLMFSRRNMRM